MAVSADATEGMDYLERLPRRVFTLYLPLAVFLFVLLFPFYWMTTTTFKPDDELYDYARFNPFWVQHPTLSHIEKLFLLRFASPSQNTDCYGVAHLSQFVDNLLTRMLHAG